MIALALVAFLATQTNTPADVRQLDWMSGCWVSSDTRREVREQWMPPAGGTMLGMSRTVSGGKTVEHEFLIIRTGASGALEYVAKPSGQAETAFTLTQSGAAQAVFENPAHDFPQRIRYAKDGERLVAVIAGPMNGKPREIRFTYERCP